MRNKCTPKRGGNTGRNASNGSTPKKDTEPDKSKGLENHIFANGESEDYQKMFEYLMSCIRQNYDNGHDIASSTEKGEACDFSILNFVHATPWRHGRYFSSFLISYSA